jgi:phage major head subunit gpT-like protein
MIISGNVPNHLVATAKTGFLTATHKEVPAYAPIAQLIDITQKNQTLVDLGAAPMPLQNKGKFNAQAFIEKTLAVTPIDWDIVVGISNNAVKDDQTGQLLSKVRNAGSNFDRHLAQQAYKALNDGDATTNYGAGYDGLSFYNNNHVDKGAAYTTVQDNLDALALSEDNFETVWIKAVKALDDQGEYTNYTYDLLVVSPSDYREAVQICMNPEDSGTANRARNPWAGKISPVVTPQFDSGAWVLVASNESCKPILIVMREQPHLENAWLDPEAPEGGQFYFKFSARYNFYYGDWRLAWMGKT